MIFFSLAKITVKCMEQNLDLTNLDLTERKSTKMLLQ